MAYDSRQYWTEQGKTYAKDFQYNDQYKKQEEDLLGFLKVIHRFDSVLEVACGFGRITNLIRHAFPEVEEYLAIDISPDQIKACVTTGVDFKAVDFGAFHSNMKFDLVIASEYLMHVVPSEIQYAINKMVSCSNMHVINIDYSVPKEDAEPLDPHNFLHDYTELYMNNNSVRNVVESPIQGVKQSIFHARL